MTIKKMEVTVIEHADNDGLLHAYLATNEPDGSYLLCSIQEAAMSNEAIRNGFRKLVEMIAHDIIQNITGGDKEDGPDVTIEQRIITKSQSH